MQELENRFYSIGIIGSLVINLLCIVFMKNPFEVFKGINYDYPMFLLYGIPLSILFGIILYIIFKIIVKIERW